MVDDLDRCDEDTVVEILQAINVVLSQSNVYTLLAIDGEMVRRAVFRHYRDPDEASLPREYQLDEGFPHEYLEKIVQFSIQLPPTTQDARTAYVRSLFTVPPPAATATVEGAGPLGPTTYAGLEVDLSQLVPPDVEAPPDEIDAASVTDTAAEADAMARYHALMDDNAREIKRAINVHRFVKLYLHRSRSAPSEETQRRLVLWVTLCLAEPEAARALLTNVLGQYQDSPDLLPPIHDVFARHGIVDVPDRLPTSDLPLLIDAANLIQLVGPPGASPVP
jgi:hypothetical protein